MAERKKVIRQGERRRADPALAAAAQGSRERDERYQQLVELAPEGILIHDGERVVLANAAAMRLAGATRRDQLVGQPIDRFLNPPYLKAVEAQLLGSGDTETHVPPVRDSFRRLDGSQVEVEVTAIAFLDGGHPSAHLVIQDISERLQLQEAARRAEEHLQQVQRMEAVGALAGGVAHEVNNMMSVILGFSDFLLRDPAIPAARLSEVRHIVRAAERTAAVTRQLLAFSRRAFHQPQVLDLDVTVQELEPVVRRLLGEDRHLTIASDASPRVWVDRGQLEQVIVNLALNARDAMRAGGTLNITTAETTVAEGTAAADGVVFRAGRYGLVIVRDTGVGMDAATRAHAFEPFFTTKPIGQGTGLGLAAADGIMKQNDGYITVRSAPGQGSTFSLYLPILSETDVLERRGEARVPRREAAPPGKTILVVEDEPAVREIATQSLESGGFEVLQAPDGAAALELLEGQEPPDLVLTDLMMPGIGGAELARRLRQRWPGLPILFMSGYSVDDLKRQGALGFGRVAIQKPFTPDRLMASVAEALAGRG